MRTPDGGWARDGGAPLDPAIAKRLSLAVQFMNTSGPVRVMEPAEYQGTNPREFGLDQPQLSIALFEGSHARCSPLTSAGATRTTSCST